MVENTYDDELWYTNFRITKKTFEFVLMIRNDISIVLTPACVQQFHRTTIGPYLVFLSSTAEYRTIGNLFGVSTSFVCLCVKVVCHAITERLAEFICFDSQKETNFLK